MTRGERSSRRTGPDAAETQVPDPVDPTPEPRRRRKGKGKELAEDPAPSDPPPSETMEVDHDSDGRISPIRELDASGDENADKTLLVDNLQDEELGTEPTSNVDALLKQQHDTQGRRPRKERRGESRPQTTTVPNGTPSFLDHLNPEDRLVFSALAHDKDAQMIYILNLGKASQRSGASNSLSGRSMVQVSHVPNPPTYDGAYEQSGQKFRTWLTSMENYLQAIAEPSAWVATAATFFREYALTWYTSWKENVISQAQPLECKVLVEGLRRNVTTKYPERHAKKCVSDMVFKGDSHKYITYYQTQLACIPSEEETLAKQVHNFIVKLPPLLREKMQDKQHEFSQLTNAFDRALTVVNNRTALATGGDKAKPEVAVGNKPKWSRNKRKSQDGQSFGDVESQKNPSKGQKQKTSTTSKPGFKAERKALMEQCKREGLCFKCGKEGHRSNECTDGPAKLASGGWAKSNKVSVSEPNALWDDRTQDGNALGSSEEVFLIDAMQAKLEAPGRLILVKLQTDGMDCVGRVDTTATANFISREAVKKVGPNVDNLSDPVVCKFANDSQGVVSEVVRQLKVEVIGEGKNFVSNEQCFVLDSLEVDIVLSIAYIRKHNVVLRPSESLLTIPDRKGDPIVIRKILDNKAKRVEVNKVSVMTPCISAKHWRKDVKGGFDCFFFHLHSSEDPEKSKAKGPKIGPHCGKVLEILEEFSDVLTNKLPKGLPPRWDVDHHIELEPGSAPQAKAPYRLSLNERNILKNSLQELLDQGFIQPSKRPYGVPAIFVSKKDGGLWLCTDYRALNKQTVKDRYPLPHMDDLFDNVMGSTKFSKVDLRTGYHQIGWRKGMSIRPQCALGLDPLSTWLCHLGCVMPLPR